MAGYDVPRPRGERLSQANTILKLLMMDVGRDVKMHHFLAGMYAYTHLLAGDTIVARQFYQQAAEPAQTFLVSYNRAKTMLSRL